MEKPIICENTTVYDYRAHVRFNSLMVGRSQWLMYAGAMVLGAVLVGLYFVMKIPAVLIFGIIILALINLMKFIFQPMSLKKTYGQILALRGQMTFVFRFHDDCFDELCKSEKGEQGIEVAYELLKTIVETKEEFLFVTKQNTAFYMRKDPDYEYETGELSKTLQAYKNYRFRGRKEKPADKA